MTATTIRLYGHMGRMFGRVHHAHLDSNTPAEAVRYLQSQFPGLAAYLTGAKDKGIGFAVFRGKENIGKDSLKEPVGSDEIRIAPILMGSKNGGVLQIIVGVILLAVSYFFPVLAPYLVPVAIGMIAGGVIQLLTPQPKASKNKDRPDNAASYVFNGAVNTQAQGNPVPLLYGRMIVGSAVVSAGINAEDYSPVSAGIGGGGVLGGVPIRQPYDGRRGPAVA
jgi:predicted phage tail protein